MISWLREFFQFRISTNWINWIKVKHVLYFVGNNISKLTECIKHKLHFVLISVKFKINIVEHEQFYSFLTTKKRCIYSSFFKNCILELIKCGHETEFIPINTYTFAVFAGKLYHSYNRNDLELIHFKIAEFTMPINADSKNRFSSCSHILLAVSTKHTRQSILVPVYIPLYHVWCNKIQRNISYNIVSHECLQRRSQWITCHNVWFVLYNTAVFPLPCSLYSRYT
jgi:hypothetical protein